MDAKTAPQGVSIASEFTPGIAKGSSETALICDSKDSSFGWWASMAWRRGQAYGQDLRDRVLACSEMTLREVALRFDVSASYVSKVRARLARLGDMTPGPQHNHVPPRLASVTDALRAQIEADPDATLRELRAWMEQHHGLRVSHPVMWTVVVRLGLTLKKTSARRRTGSRGHRASTQGVDRTAAAIGPASSGVPR